MNGHLSHLRRLQIIQNRALRIVLQVDNRFNRQTLYDTLKVDCLTNRWKKQALILIFKLLNNLLSPNLGARIERRESTYNLRNHDILISLPKPKTNFLKNSPLYSASKLFNSLTQEIRIITSFSLFSKALSHHSFVTF